MESLYSSEIIRIFTGLIAGVLLGFAARWGRFCSLGAIEDAMFGNDFGRARTWIFAMGIAILGTTFLKSTFQLDVSSIGYVRLESPYIASLVGGIIFGLGMALAGTCAHGTLARLGGGDLKSIITLVMIGISGYATLFGMLYPLRLYIQNQFSYTFSVHTMDVFLASNFGFSTDFWAYGLALICIIFAMLLRSAPNPYISTVKNTIRHYITGLLIGLVIVTCWWITGIVTKDPFQPNDIVALSYIRPISETILFFMKDELSAINFSIASVIGVVIGAFITSKMMNEFRWEACDDHQEMRRQILGGILMGFGGVLALGCTIGQGLSAFSVLAMSAPFVITGIVFGSWIGLNLLISGRVIDFLRLFRRS